MTYFTIKEIKEANRERGDFWFSPDTMRFWGCRILPRVYAGRYFIASNRPIHGLKRTYRICVADETGKIDTVDFCYETAGLAKKALERLIDSENQG